MLFTGADALAQQYNPYYGTSTYGGVDRSIDRQQRAPKTKNKKKLEEDKKKREDLTYMMTEYLTKELKLDDFQKAAVSSIYKENEDDIKSIGSDGSPGDVQKDQLRKILEKIDGKILPILSKDQQEAYNKIIAERKY
jgi:dihydroorotase